MQNKIAGWSSWLAHWTHNPKVVGSSPTPATKITRQNENINISK